MFSKFLYLLACVFAVTCLETFGYVNLTYYVIPPIVGIASMLFAVIFALYARGSAVAGY